MPISNLNILEKKRYHWLVFELGTKFQFRYTFSHEKCLSSKFVNWIWKIFYTGFFTGFNFDKTNLSSFGITIYSWLG